MTLNGRTRTTCTPMTPPQIDGRPMTADERKAARRAADRAHDQSILLERQLKSKAGENRPMARLLERDYPDGPPNVSPDHRHMKTYNRLVADVEKESARIAAEEDRVAAELKRNSDPDFIAMQESLEALRSVAQPDQIERLAKAEVLANGLATSEFWELAGGLADENLQRANARANESAATHVDAGRKFAEDGRAAAEARKVALKAENAARNTQASRLADSEQAARGALE